MTLDQQVKGQLLEDHKKVNERIYEVLQSGINNFIADPDYLDPSLGDQIHLDEEQGEFKYYSRIRVALETVLNTGEIAKELLPPRAPGYWNRVPILLKDKRR